ncbi:MAG: tetratricopeptide repeat protein, partial [Bacteroidetes bacterium]|nr:tetratricopeptide repeat protein [Bacteroidota bacterium]
YQKAIEAFEKSLKEEPNDDAAAYGIALSLEKQNQAGAAIEFMQKACNADPKNSYYKSHLAKLYQTTGEFQKAAQLQESLIAIFPGNEQLYFDAAMNYASAKNAKKALKILNKLGGKYGNSPDLVLYQYNILLKVDPNSAKGIELLEKANREFPNDPGILSYLIDHYMALGNYTKGTELLEKLVLADPSNALANLLLGDLSLEAGKKERAFSYYKQAIKGDGLSAKTITETFIKMKETWLTDKEIGTLMANCEVDFPKDPIIYSLIGDYHYAKKDIAATINYYKKAVELNPDLSAIWNELLLLEFETEDWESLKNDAKKVVELYPLSPIGFYMAGTALNRSGEYALAKFTLEEGLFLIVNDDQLKGEFKAQLAEAAFGTSDSNTGVNLFEEALKLAPNNNYILNRYFTKTVFKLKDLKKARELHELIVKSETNENRKKFRLAQISLIEKKYQEALTLTQSIDLTYSYYRDVLELQGDLFFFLNKKEEAVKQWKQAKSNGKKSIILDQKITTGNYHEPL